MNLKTIKRVLTELNKYTNECNIGNEPDTFDVFIEANIEEEEKELFLHDLDSVLPYGITFNHEYKNGKMKVKFKEVAQ